LKDRQKEEYLYLLDRFVCDFLKERKIKFGPDTAIDCLHSFSTPAIAREIEKLLKKYFEVVEKLVKMLDNDELLDGELINDVFSEKAWGGILVVIHDDETKQIYKEVCDELISIEQDIDRVRPMEILVFNIKDNDVLVHCRLSARYRELASKTEEDFLDEICGILDIDKTGFEEAYYDDCSIEYVLTHIYKHKNETESD
jgi:hypothetical protein